MTTTKAPASTQVYRVYIKATPEAVWTAITDPAWTQRYGYGGRGEYDLRKGGTYRGWTSDEMRAMGAPDLAVDGEILESDPPRRLVQTWRMVMDERMTAEGFTRLTYEIDEGRSGVARLTVTHELEGAELLQKMLSGGMEDEGAGGGWAWVLSDLKTVLETGAGFDKS
jgi:uncharacterized protein YndB with AHSA1/START domain